jgi:hypothetical protein
MKAVCSTCSPLEQTGGEKFLVYRCGPVRDLTFFFILTINKVVITAKAKNEKYQPTN